MPPTYAYVVGVVSFDWHGTRLHRGDVIRGDDARELEQPENAALLARTNRVFDDIFAHYDTVDAPAPAPAPAEVK